MSKGRLKIIPLPECIVNDFVRRSCVLRYEVFESAVEEKILWQDFPLFLNNVHDPDDCDGFMMMALMDAMARELDLHIAGSVDQLLLYNLCEYMKAWNKWIPDLFKIIEIIPRNVTQSSFKIDGVISAFSGGLDASYIVHDMINKKNKLDDLKFCLMVHGFDIPLHQNEKFSHAFKVAETSLESLGIRLLRAATNYREIINIGWDLCVGIVLAAVMNNFKAFANVSMVGSSRPYDNLLIPSGTSPIIDHLFSSGSTLVFHHGASHSRTEKALALSSWKDGVNSLRVCWEGRQIEGNCRRCEKCVRTKLNFLCNNLEVPNSLTTDENIGDEIASIKLKRFVLKGQWKEIYLMADKNKIAADWVDLVKQKID